MPFIGKRANMPPLGLLTLAAIIDDAFECRLIDANAEILRDEDIEWADLVMISAMIVQSESMAVIIRRCNVLGVAVVAGGPYPTSCHEEIVGVDHFVLGEAELVLPAFVDDYLAGTAKTIYQSDGWVDLSTTPIPRFDLCRLDYYDTIPLQFSRGCPFDCEFCDIVVLFGRTVRVKSVAQFIGEVDAVYRIGFRGALFIVDDNFVGRRRAAKELLRALADWQCAHRYPFQFSTEASLDMASDTELMDLLAAARFDMVFVGLETPVEQNLLSTGKQQNLQRSMSCAVRDIQRRGIEVTAGFIVGFDDDPNDIFRRQSEFIHDLAVPTAMVGLLMALPETRLYRRLESEGRILGRSSGNNTHQTELNFETKLPRETLVTGYQRLLARLYSPRNYFSRCLRFVIRLPRRRTVIGLQRRLSFGRRELRAVISSLLKQGGSWYGWWYFFFLVRALLMRPHEAVRIMTLAIKGHHYFTITKQMSRG